MKTVKKSVNSKTKKNEPLKKAKKVSKQKSKSLKGGVAASHGGWDCVTGDPFRRLND